MIADIRSRIADLVEVLDGLDSLLASDRANQLPGLLLARVAIAVDEAANRLAGHAETLSRFANKPLENKEPCRE
jgi:hypothetical protein